jgi:hypothetical protein
MLEPHTDEYRPTYPPSLGYTAAFTAALVVGVMLFEGVSALLA